jgi:hypothetical protein
MFLRRVGVARLVLVVGAVLALGGLAGAAVLFAGGGARRLTAVPDGGGAAWAAPGNGASNGSPSAATASASASPSAPASASPSASRTGTASPVPVAPAAPGTPAGWTLRWSPEASRDGLGAFEGVEDDRAGSDPGVKHIYVQGNDFRIDMNMRVRDSSPDRQRNEVKGMHAGNQDLVLGLGETWRLDWSLYIPDSLKATTTFTHIMQLKMPGDGSSPILTMDLRRVGGVPKIQVVLFSGNIVVGSTDLTPLQNRWLSTSLAFTIGDSPNGSVTWTLSAGGNTLVNATKTGVDTWLGDRVRPKWGIYRSLGDTSGSLQDCYLLLTNMRGYQKS